MRAAAEEEQLGLFDRPALTRADKLRRAFQKFHQDNPHVYQRIKEICFALQGKGWKHYSMRTIIAVLRFEWDLETGGEQVATDDGPARVKLNNNHSPYYARMLLEDHPTFKGFFQLRKAEGE
jgi:hypothetical protein